MEILTLKKNKFDVNKDAEIKEIIKSFKDGKIETDIDFNSKDDKEKPNDESNKNKLNENNNNN